MPKVNGSVPRDCPPIQRKIANTGCFLFFWSTRFKSEIPIISSLGLINLLKWLTEHRKLIYSPDYWFLTKHTTWNSQMEEIHGARYVRNGLSVYDVLNSLLSTISMCSPTWNSILLGFYGGFITETQMMKSLAIWNWTQPQVPLPS